MSKRPFVINRVSSGLSNRFSTTSFTTPPCRLERNGRSWRKPGRFRFREHRTGNRRLGDDAVIVPLWPHSNSRSPVWCLVLPVTARTATRNGGRSRPATLPMESACGAKVSSRESRFDSRHEPVHVVLSRGIEGFRKGVLGLDVPIAEALVETVGVYPH